MENFQRAQIVLLISDQLLDHLKLKLVLSVVLSVFSTGFCGFWRGVCIRDAASILQQLILCGDEVFGVILTVFLVDR